MVSVHGGRRWKERRRTRGGKYRPAQWLMFVFSCGWLSQPSNGVGVRLYLRVVCCFFAHFPQHDFIFNPVQRLGSDSFMHVWMCFMVLFDYLLRCSPLAPHARKCFEGQSLFAPRFRQTISLRESAVPTIRRPLYKFEQPNQKPIKSYFLRRERWQECCGYVTRLRCARFSRKRVSGRPDAESFGTNSKGTTHPVYATPSKYPGKERTIAWTNASQTSSSAKSIHFKI